MRDGGRCRKRCTVISSAVLCRELIGRSSELEHLLALAREAPEGRSSAVVVIRGEAGVGKTRLMREFAELAEREGRRAVACAARERTRIIVSTRVPAGQNDAAAVTVRLAAYELAGADAALLRLDTGGQDLLGRIRPGEQRLPVMLVGEELDEPVGYDLAALGVSEIVYRDVVLRVANDRVTRNVTAIRGSGLLATVLGEIAPVQQVFDLAAKR